MTIKELQVIFNKTTWLLSLLVLSSCNMEDQKTMVYAERTNALESQIVVNKNDLELKSDLGLMYYHNQPFTGISEVLYTANIKAESITYKHGKREGLFKKWFPDGTLSFEAHYANGLQHGVTKTWWKNGYIRSESNYINGIVNGLQKQWYKTGEKFKEMRIVAGKEEGLQKAWRRNGKIYNNYEAKNGRIFGLKRAGLCFELEDEIVQNN